MAQRASVDIRTLHRMLGGEIVHGQNGRYVLCAGPGHRANDRSLSVKPADNDDGFIVHSFANDDWQVCKDYVRQKLGAPPFQPKRPNGSHAEPRKLIATHDYHYADGTLAFQVLRYSPKKPRGFSQRKPDGQGGFIWNTDGIPPLIYRLPQVIGAMSQGRPILVVEGEKDADAAWKLGIPATCNPCGAGKWLPEHSELLRGADIVPTPDNDEKGRDHVGGITAMSTGIANRVCTLDLGVAKEGGDLSDWIDAGGTREQLDGLIAAALTAESSPPPRQDANEAKPSEVKLTYFDELAEPTPKPWLIKNVIARGETSSWIAPPGKGKSALLTDIAIHLGAGTNWRGHLTKNRSGTLYLALERADLVKRRLTAHRLRDSLPDNLPIAIWGQVIDLMNRTCVQVILDALKQAEQHFECAFGLVTIDTYPKGIAAGGGDESSAKDQNVALANLRRVLDRAPHLHIAGIGHTGKDEGRGERGSNARLADVDLQVQLSGEDIRTATVNKANDQPDGPLTSFELEPFDFGRDEDGDLFRTYILSTEIIDGAAAAANTRRLSDKQKLALEALAEATLASGKDPPPDYQLPTGIKVVTANEWLAELHRRSIVDPDGANPRARFHELRNGLAARKRIGVRDGNVWLAGNQ